MEDPESKLGFVPSQILTETTAVRSAVPKPITANINLRRPMMFILRNYKILTGGTATVTETGTAPGRDD